MTLRPRLGALCALLPFVYPLSACPDEDSIPFLVDPCQLQPTNPACADGGLDGWGFDIGPGDGFTNDLQSLPDDGPLDIDEDVDGPPDAEVPDGVVVFPPDVDEPDNVVVVFPPDTVDDGGGVTDPGDGGSSDEDVEEPEDTDVPPSCEPGFTFCEGNVAVACVDGELEFESCAVVGLICEDGVCVEAPSCIPDCSGKACGSDGCDGLCGVCDSGDSCVDFQCVSPTGGLSCFEVNSCIGDCDGDQTCGQACIEEGTPTAQEQLAALANCSAGCGGAPGCLLNNGCGDEFATCIGPNGGAGCQATIQCVGECNGADACQQGCIFEASVPQLAVFYELNWCLGDVCPNGGQACVQQAAAGACASYFSACLP